MAAPKNPNVAEAAAARRKMGDLTASNRLFTAGYLVCSPEELKTMPAKLVDQLAIWLVTHEMLLPRGLTELAQ